METSITAMSLCMWRSSSSSEAANPNKIKAQKIPERDKEEDVVSGGRLPHLFLDGSDSTAPCQSPCPLTYSFGVISALLPPKFQLLFLEGGKANGTLIEIPPKFHHCRGITVTIQQTQVVEFQLLFLEGGTFYGTILSFFADRTTEEIVQRILGLENPEADTLVWPVLLNTNGEETVEGPVQGPPLKINPKKPARKFTRKMFLAKNECEETEQSEKAFVPLPGPINQAVAKLPLSSSLSSPAKRTKAKSECEPPASSPIPKLKYAELTKGKSKISHVRKLVEGKKSRDIER